MYIHKKLYSEEDKCLTIYTQGCNMRCAGCSNPEIVLFKKDKIFNKEDIKKYKDIKKIIIKGGEPTLQKDLISFLKFIKETSKNIDVIIYTNGTIPSVILKLTRNILVSEIVLCLKNSFIDYDKVTYITGAKDWKCIYKSCLIIKNSETKFKFLLNQKLNKATQEKAMIELSSTLKEKIHITN